MERVLRALSQMASRWGWLVPSAVLGLYLGRVVSELIRPGFGGALAITAGAIALSIVILKQNSFDSTWPLLLLFIYVVYPDADWSVALTTALLCLIVLFLNWLRKGNIFANSNTRIPLIAAAALSLGFLALYVISLAPDLLPADSGEFQLVASTLGVAHPTGFPLYTMLANLMTRLPVSATPAYLVNLLSAITGALTLLLVYGSVFRLTRSVIGGLIAAIALGGATTFWAQSTTANVRSLTAFFAALAIYLLIMVKQAKTTSGDGDDNQLAEKLERGADSRRLWVYIILFILILTLGVTHHTSLLFMGIFFVLYLLMITIGVVKESRRWPWIALAVAIGLIPLIYLPLRSAAGAQGAPEDLATASGFFNHVLALGFRGDFFYFTDPVSLWHRLGVMANVLTFQFDPLLLAAMAIGFILLLRRDWKLAFLLAGSFAIMIIITATYRAPQTVEYLMPAYVPAAILLGYAVGVAHVGLRDRVDDSHSHGWRRAILALFVGIVAIAAIRQVVDRYPSFEYLSEDYSARDFTEKLLGNAPEDAVILADWHWVTPLWYLQQVEGERPDVEVKFVFPTAEKYGQTWARRIEEELSAGHAVIATHFDEDAYANLPPADPIDNAFLFGNQPVLVVPGEYESLEITFGESIEVLGYSLDEPPLEIGRESILTVAWRPIDQNLEGITLFAHLVGNDGLTYAQEDVGLKAKEEGINFTQFRLTPRPGSTPGEYELMLGAYGAESLLDAQGAARTPIVSYAVSAASAPPVTFNPVRRPLSAVDSDLTLVGYDWDNSIPGTPRLYLHWKEAEGYYSEVSDQAGREDVLPSTIGPWGLETGGFNIGSDENQRYIPFSEGIIWNGKSLQDEPLEPGQTLKLQQNFFSSRPIFSDIVVSVRLVGFEDDGFHWSWWDLDDSIPAMGAIPTLKWIDGSAVRDPHWLVVDEEAWSGQTVSPLLRLYDAFTGRSVPILDERISNETPWLPLGATFVAE